VALGAFLNVTNLTYTTALRNELTTISQKVVSQLAQTENMNKEIAALEEQISSVEATADAFTATRDELTAGKDEINGDLSQINSCLPGTKDDRLVSVTHSGDTVTVTGLASDEDAVFSYARALRATNRFALVVITDMHEEEHQSGFTLTLSK